MLYVPKYTQLLCRALSIFIIHLPWSWHAVCEYAGQKWFSNYVYMHLANLPVTTSFIYLRSWEVKSGGDNSCWWMEPVKNIALFYSHGSTHTRFEESKECAIMNLNLVEWTRIRRSRKWTWRVFGEPKNQAKGCVLARWLEDLTTVCAVWRIWRGTGWGHFSFEVALMPIPIAFFPHSVGFGTNFPSTFFFSSSSPHTTMLTGLITLRIPEMSKLETISSKASQKSFPYYKLQHTQLCM